MEDTTPTRQHAWGEFSRRMLADLQSEALSGAPHTVVLVEGLSDYVAIQAVARKRGREFDGEGIVIVPMGGATNVRRFLTTFGPRGRNARIAALCDAAEAEYFARALGGTEVESVIDRAGELPSLRTLQQMPAHRDRPHAQQLHRFMGTRSARKYRYAQLLAEALPPEDVPRPLRELVDSLA